MMEICKQQSDCSQDCTLRHLASIIDYIFFKNGPIWTIFGTKLGIGSVARQGI